MELGVIGGSILARHKLALLEFEAGQYKRAFKQLLICAKAGHKSSLDTLKVGFQGGDVTKDEYEKALRAFQKHDDDARSIMRDEALVYAANPSMYWENS